MTLRLLAMAWRMRREGNPKPLRHLLSVARYGITHWRCPRCGRLKGPTLRRSCEKCAAQALLRAVFKEEYP